MKDVNPFFVQSHCMGGRGGIRHETVCAKRKIVRLRMILRLAQKIRALLCHTKTPCQPGYEAAGGKGDEWARYHFLMNLRVTVCPLVITFNR